MSNPRSLAYQASCVSHLLAASHRFVVEGVLAAEIFEGAEHALKTLRWLEVRADLLRELVRLDRDAPSIAALLRQIPEARIDHVRFYNDEAEAAE